MNEFYNKLKYFEETEGIKKDVYYHYTSLDALYEIVKHRTFRLMSLKSSNDRTELFYKPENITDAVAKVYETEEDESMKIYYGLMKTSWEAHKDAMLKELKSKKSPYALCLSQKKDNLTHWDRYANRCTGVSIGLNVNALDVLYRRTASSGFASSLFDLGRALYTQDAISDRIKREMIQGFKWLEQIDQTTGENDIKKTIEKSGYLFVGAACRNIMKFAKKEAFFDEDEFRLYFDPGSIKTSLSLIDGMKGEIDDEFYKNVRNNFLEVVDCLNVSKEEFAKTRSGIRGYHNLCLKEIWGSGVIPEIVLGPMCVQNKSELHRFLKSNGLEGTKVTVSAVPIR